VYFLSINGIAINQVFNAGFPVWKVRWSPDGNWLAVTVEAEGIDYRTFIVSVEGEPGFFEIEERDHPSMLDKFAGLQTVPFWDSPRILMIE